MGLSGRPARAAVLAAVLLSAGCSAGTPAAPTATPPRPTATPPLSTATPARPTAAPTGGLLTASGNGDGDSWKDTAGREYRLGLVNTPEVGECYGSQATAARKKLVAGGFRARVYMTDRYGRSVSVVTAADGTNVNVWLARNGFANDRYLAQFRGENPSLAAELDGAFAAARAEHRGLWGACPARG